MRSNHIVVGIAFWLMVCNQVMAQHDPNFSYPFGFQGMEREDDVKGKGNAYSTQYRSYDAQTVRWLSVDPKAEQYPGWTPYKALLNNPIVNTDKQGDSEDDVRRRFIDYLEQQGIAYDIEVPIRVHTSSGPVEGRADLVYADPHNPGQWVPVEFKEFANSPYNGNQHQYLDELMAGAEWEVTGRTRGSGLARGYRRTGGHFGMIIHSGNVHQAGRSVFQWARHTVLRRRAGLEEVLEFRSRRIMQQSQHGWQWMREIQRRMPDGVWRLVRIAPFVGLGVAVVTYPVGASAEDQFVHVVDAGIGEIPLVGMVYDGTMALDAGGQYLLERYRPRLRSRPMSLRDRVELQYRLAPAPFMLPRRLLELRRMLTGR